MKPVQRDLHITFDTTSIKLQEIAVINVKIYVHRRDLIDSKLHRRALESGDSQRTPMKRERKKKEVEHL